MRKAIPLIFFCLPFMASAQGTWMQMTNMDGAARQWALGFTIDGKGYVTGGMNNDSLILGDLWEYDPTTDTWLERATMPSSRARGVSMGVGDKGFVGTGSGDSVEWNADWWMYDAVMNEWTPRQNLPGPGRVDAIGFAVMNKCFVGGGLSAGGTTYTDFYEFDPEINTWTPRNDLPADMPKSAVSKFSIGEKAYVVGGRTDLAGEFSQETYEYDPVMDTWTMRAPFPGSGRIYPAAFAIGNIGIVGSGDSGMLTDDWYAYDPGTDTWQNVAAFPGVPRAMAVAFAIGTSGYVATGSTGVTLQTNDLWEFVPGITSISDAGPSSNALAYPNPSNGPMKLKLTEPTSHTVFVTVTDLAGREVWAESLIPSTELAFDLSSLPAGAYMIEHRQGERKGTSMVILEK